jgi:hypothetical protein
MLGMLLQVLKNIDDSGLVALTQAETLRGANS